MRSSRITTPSLASNSSSYILEPSFLPRPSLEEPRRAVRTHTQLSLMQNPPQPITPCRSCMSSVKNRSGRRITSCWPTLLPRATGPPDAVRCVQPRHGHSSYNRNTLAAIQHAETAGRGGRGCRARPECVDCHLHPGHRFTAAFPPHGRGWASDRGAEHRTENYGHAPARPARKGPPAPRFAEDR